MQKNLPRFAIEAGFVPILVLVGVVIIAAVAGAFYFGKLSLKLPSLPTPSPSSQVCAQVITPARNPQTGECKEFSTPCNVPEGWKTVPSCPTK